MIPDAELAAENSLLQAGRSAIISGVYSVYSVYSVYRLTPASMTVIPGAGGVLLRRVRFERQTPDEGTVTIRGTVADEWTAP